MINKTDALTRLQHHVGHHNGVTAEALAAALGVPKRHVRTLITELRLDGIAVCGHPRDGYYIAATAEDIEKTANFLRSRAMHSLVLESRLRKISLPDLLGQLRLRS